MENGCMFPGRKDPIREYFDYQPPEDSCGGTCATPDLNAPPAPPDNYYVNLENSDRVQHLLLRRTEGEDFSLRLIVMFFITGFAFVFVDLSHLDPTVVIAAYALCATLAAVSFVGFFLVQGCWLRPIQRELDQIGRQEHEKRKNSELQ